MGLHNMNVDDQKDVRPTLRGALRTLYQ